MGGYKEVVAQLNGSGVFGRMKFESGVHRVQRVPATEAQGRIHTSAATVAILPVPEEVNIEVRDQDIRIDTYRSSGAGGQHVNKTDSAVRITHEASGIVVQCQNERSQTQNKAVAMQMLKAKLIELEERKRAEEVNAERGEVKDVAWGSQIRSYVLQPYTMVKDHRTEYEVGDAQRVLDGDIDGFIREYLNRTA
jgi:peptide chain release factor 2